MSKLIALQSGTPGILLADGWNNDFSNLKQQLLLFDQIGIFRLSRFYKILGESLGSVSNLDQNISSKVESIITELEWLRHKV